MNCEQLLKNAVQDWKACEEEEEESIVKDLVYDLVKLIEKGATMPSILAKNHLKQLVSTWKRFCDQTSFVNEEGIPEGYAYQLFGSAVIVLNDGNGEAWVKKNKVLWSHDSKEIFKEWVLEGKDERSVHYQNWVKRES